MGFFYTFSNHRKNDDSKILLVLEKELKPDFLDTAVEIQITQRQLKFIEPKSS